MICDARRHTLGFIVTIVLLLPMESEAQLICSLGSGASIYNPGLDGEAADHAIDVGKRVADVLCNGRCGVTMYRNPTSPNALTFVLPTGAAKVVYQPQFMNDVEATYGESAVFGIVAHEVGHVVDGRTPVGWMLPSWSRELRADAWAGCAIARAKFSPDETGKVLKAISMYPSLAHPSWEMRLPALETGYKACGGTTKLPERGKEW